MAIRDLGLPPEEPQRPYLVPPRRPGRWKPVLAWIGAIVLALIVIVVAGIYIALHSQKVHNYVLNLVQQKAGAALNTPVQLQNFTLHLHNLGLDLYGLTVYGVGPGAGQPLLQVDHVGLGVRVISVVHRQWNLDRVAVDHPVVDLIVDKDGQNNLPTMQSSGSSSNTNAFDLAIRHIVLDRGAIYYNDRESPLYADLNDLQFQSSYDAAANGRYYGSMSYRDGHLQYGSYAPMPHDVKAQFEARRDGMTLSDVKLTSGQSQVLL
ncbi:MAG TPA: AsmA family protein, partial [Terriglobales bacterium]|nr:AsmA family protein [Terriglobales bacterium]